MTKTHQNLDRRSLALHRVIAEKIRQDPSLLEIPKTTLQRWRGMVCANSIPYIDEWQRLIDADMDECLRVATENYEYAAALRQSSPFCGILTSLERRRFLREWERAPPQLQNANVTVLTPEAFQLATSLLNQLIDDGATEEGQLGNLAAILVNAIDEYVLQI